ncbi:NAD(P)H-binding protein [Streptomyces kaniharaensis]|uniref:NAD(P)H-binding protein n=1 Tax=Streptomyces kaniharaensis TaxID=212423 RepID=A0A6N7KH40_9ACTN|nr:NAD(P)H-binding protein [Streptomyces kaniharaensis]MQS10762.1 NAD(P)H-binding protein [Streptomyces kaniharaensis]
MLVSVTGGTGFVGVHSVAEIVRRGHRVRMLVRDPAAAERVLATLAVDPAAVDLLASDVTEERDVRRAVAGADAVLHAASVYSFDSRRHAAMRATNAPAVCPPGRRPRRWRTPSAGCTAPAC